MVPDAPNVMSVPEVVQGFSGASLESRMLPFSHQDIGICWGTFLPHGCAFGLSKEFVVDFQIILSVTAPSPRFPPALRSSPSTCQPRPPPQATCTHLSAQLHLVPLITAYEPLLRSAPRQLVSSALNFPALFSCLISFCLPRLLPGNRPASCL